MKDIKNKPASGSHSGQLQKQATYARINPLRKTRGFACFSLWKSDIVRPIKKDFAMKKALALWSTALAASFTVAVGGKDARSNAVEIEAAQGTEITINPAANDAVADDQALDTRTALYENFSNTSAPEVDSATTAKSTAKVGVKDIRGKSERFATALTAMASNDAIVVLYRGSDRSLFDKARLGASQAKAGGINTVKGIVWADADSNSLGGKDCVQIYMDGIPVTKKWEASDPFTQRLVKEFCEDIHKKYLVTAPKTEPEGPAVVVK